MNIFEKHKCKKQAKAVMHQAMHVVNMRGDLLDEASVTSIKTSVSELSDTLKARDWDSVSARIDALQELLDKVAIKYPVRGGAWRENFEVAVVAVAVAMGLRAYFIQPFKIPTGSMQPTLYGITSDYMESPSLMDRFPLKLVKFVVTGDWYSVRRAQASGRLGEARPSSTDPSSLLFTIGGNLHKIPKMP
jgi:signal peptidase I